MGGIGGRGRWNVWEGEVEGNPFNKKLKII